MSEKVDILIIGAGQAGLCVSYYLCQNGYDHVILEQAPVIVPTWRNRWDSFTLVLPNWSFHLPGMSIPGTVADGFFKRDEVVARFEEFVATFEPAIRLNTKVITVEQAPPGNNYLVHTNRGTFEANHVVVATGTYQQPRIPTFGADLPPYVMQVHTSEYRNPESLPDGAVLVVGTGQSGRQIAEELYLSGRKVYLCVSSAPRFTRFYRGKDMAKWLEEVGFMDAPASSLESSRMRFAANPVATGKDGGHDLNLHQFARDGVNLLGRATGVNGDVMSIAPDLIKNLAKSDEFAAQLEKNIDTYIAANNIDAPPAINGPKLRDGYGVEIIEQLDLHKADISTIIWGTGYQFDFSWIKLPILDQDGYPIQKRGISDYPGLYFIGLHFMDTRKSGILLGVAADAEYVAHHIHT